MGISSVGWLAFPSAEGERESSSQEVKVAEQKAVKPQTPVIKKAAVVRTDAEITRTAEYECSIPAQASRYIARTDIEIGGREAFTDQKYSPVSIRVVPNEAPQQTEDRFEEAAKIERRGLMYRGKMSGCYDFKRFLSTAEMALNRKKIEVETKRAQEEWGRALDRALEQCKKNGGSFRCYQ